MLEIEERLSRNEILRQVPFLFPSTSLDKPCHLLVLAFCEAHQKLLQLYGCVKLEIFEFPTPRKKYTKLS